MKYFDKDFIVAEHDIRHNRVIYVAKGKVIRSYPVDNPLDLQLLSNGHLLLSSNQAIVELDKDWNEVWKLESKRLAFFSCHQTEKGNIVFGDASKAQICEVDKRQQLVRSFDFPLVREPGEYLYAFRLIRPADGDRLLIACHSKHKLIEVDWSGKVWWEIDLPGAPYMPVRLDNGNMLVSLGPAGKIVEVTDKKEIIWEYDMNKDNDLSTGWIAGISILANGNIVYSDSLYDRLIEITRKKEMVSVFQDRNILLHPSTNVIIEEGRKN